jgi:hypothetical protein
MGWLSYKEDNEKTTQEAQDNKQSQIQQPSSGPGNSSSGSSFGNSNSEHGNVDDEPGSPGGSGAHE